MNHHQKKEFLEKNKGGRVVQTDNAFDAWDDKGVHVISKRLSGAGVWADAEGHETPEEKKVVEEKKK